MFSSSLSLKKLGLRRTGEGLRTSCLFRVVGDFPNEVLGDARRAPGDAARVVPRRGVPSRESRDRLRRLEGDPGILPFESFLAGLLPFESFLAGLLIPGLCYPEFPLLIARGLAARLPAFGLAAIFRLGLAALLLLPSLGLGAR